MKDFSYGEPTVTPKLAVGETYGEWTVVKANTEKLYGRWASVMRCSCGYEGTRRNYDVINRSRSCIKCSRKTQGKRIKGDIDEALQG